MGRMGAAAPRRLSAGLLSGTAGPVDGKWHDRLPVLERRANESTIASIKSSSCWLAGTAGGVDSAPM
jgi:hypothetical protein